jgi:hypothetical protein
MTPDEQEARSRALSNDIIITLLLSSGNIAVFNSARALCGIVADLRQARLVWYAPPRNSRTAAEHRPTLEELGL